MEPYTVLYYPDFQPDVAWLRKILLLTDRVVRIVPTDVNFHDPDEILHLLEVMPDTPYDFQASVQDVSIEGLKLQRLEKAFTLLPRKQKGKRRKVEILIPPDGGFSVPGHVFLHKSKISAEIGSLLEKYGLANRTLDKITEAMGSSEFRVVDIRASNLILARVADNVARRYGFDTITDRPLEHGLNALANLNKVDHSGAPEGALLASIASMYIPREIFDMSWRHYRDLRDSYYEIRRALKDLVRELAAVNRLDRIEDSNLLQERVNAVAQELVWKAEEWRRSKFARMFRAWTPLCIGGLLSIATTVVDPKVACAMATATFAIQVIEEYVGQQAPLGHDRLYQMLIGMRRDIMRRSPVRRLLEVSPN